MAPRAWRAAAVLALCATAWGVRADDEGRKLFTGVVPACALCHTLRAAGAQGEIGPSLDELKPDAARVAKALRSGIGQMPAFPQLNEAQIQALARYVEGATR